jgi:metal-dependent amidase/aminoacylase/carboxypeptidase family protein
VTDIANGIAASFGGQAKVDFRNIFAPTVNDPAQADYAADICADIVSPDNVIRKPPLIMASEDFSFMLQKVSGCYINIGNGDDKTAREVHNPGYEFNDQAIPYGVSFFTSLVEKKLAIDGEY